MRISASLLCKAALIAAFGYIPAFAQSSADLSSFGAKPNDPNFNCRDAFQKAFNQLRSAGGGTLRIPAGDFYIFYPDIARDLDRRNPQNQEILKNQAPTLPKMLVVPSRVILQGATDGSGRALTRIHWKISSVPLLSFVDADYAGVKNLAFVYDGTQPQYFPFMQEDYLSAMGKNVRWLGGQYEISAVIYSLGSSHLQFQNLSFSSSHKDNEHTFAFGIVLKGQGNLQKPQRAAFRQLAAGTRVPGGGIAACTSDNSISSVHFEDFIMGVLASAQCGLHISNVSGDYRGSWYRSFDPSRETGPTIKNIGPPGHLIYVTFQNAYDVVAGSDQAMEQRIYRGTTRNKNLVIENITEGPHTLSNFNSLGTLSLKNIEGGTVKNVTSQHPAGLIQTLIDAHDMTLENLRWSSDVDLCAESQTRQQCRVAIIAFEPGQQESKDLEESSGVRFSNVELSSHVREAAVKISQEDKNGPLSRDISFDHLTINGDPYRGPDNASQAAVLLIRADNSKFSNVSYNPQVPAGGGQGSVAEAVDINARSTNDTVDITIHHAPGVPPDATRTAVDPGGERLPYLTPCRLDRYR